VVWNGSHSLFRCGPGIDANGNYTNVITGSEQQTGVASRLVDGLGASCTLEVITTAAVSKSLSFRLCLQGIGQQTFSGTASTYSRIVCVQGSAQWRAVMGCGERLTAA
jgi:hypothetical protein